MSEETPTFKKRKIVSKIKMPMRMDYDGQLSLKPDARRIKNQKTSQCLLERWFEIGWVAQYMFGMKMIQPKDWHITVASRKEVAEWPVVHWDNKPYTAEFNYEIEDIKKDLLSRNPRSWNMWGANFAFAPSNYLVIDTKGRRSFGMSVDFCCSDIPEFIDEYRGGLQGGLPIKSAHMTLCNDTGNMEDSIGWTNYSSMDQDQIGCIGIPGFSSTEDSMFSLLEEFEIDKQISYEALRCLGVKENDWD